MKLLYSTLIFSIFLKLSSSYLNYETDKDNCPLDKSNWCAEFYECTEEDKELSKKEKDIFDEFMTALEEYDKLKTTRFTFECISKDEIRPVQVDLSKIEDKMKTKYQLYGVYQQYLTACNNCDEYPTPSTYFECVIPIRAKMLNDILGIISKIKAELKKTVGNYRNNCNKILK